MAVTLATVDGTWVNSGASYDAGELRRADAALFATEGIATGLTVTVDASDNVTVAPGSWVISGEDAMVGTGVYRGGIAAAVVGALEARDATYSRVDLVVARQYDSDVVGAHTSKAAVVEVIKGTPAASPTAPALPDMAIELARVTVPVSGGAAATVNSSQRPVATAVGTDARKVSRGKFSGSISSGVADVNHGLGEVPLHVSITGVNGALFRVADASMTSTILPVRVREPGSATDNWSGSVSFYWQVEA